MVKVIHVGYRAGYKVWVRGAENRHRVGISIV